MSTYRLYTEDVKNGLVDFNDEVYHVLATTTKPDGTTTALVYRHTGYTNFFVVHGLQYEELNSIHWSYSTDFGQNLLGATGHFGYYKRLHDIIYEQDKVKTPLRKKMIETLKKYNEENETDLLERINEGVIEEVAKLLGLTPEDLGIKKHSGEEESDEYEAWSDLMFEFLSDWDIWEAILGV